MKGSPKLAIVSNALDSRCSWRRDNGFYHVGKALDFYGAKYENFIVMGDLNPTYLGGVKMTPSAINAFVTQTIEKKIKRKQQIFVKSTLFLLGEGTYTPSSSRRRMRWKLKECPKI